MVVVVIKHPCLHYSYENNAKESKLQLKSYILIEGKLAFSFEPNEKWVHVIAQCLANNNVPLGYI